MHLRTLDDSWQIRPLERFNHGIYPHDETGWLAATVPGHWQTIPGLEQHRGKVVYRCCFTMAERPAPGLRHWLCINGAFYWSQAYCNGVDLGRHEGYFAPYEREISGLLERENSLLVEVDCPDEHNVTGKRMITGVFSHWDCLDPAANPGGIWLPVEIQQSGPVRLQQVRLHTESLGSTAVLRYGVELDAAEAAPVLLRWTFAPRTFEGAAQVIEQNRALRRGAQALNGMLRLHEPRLWWSHDLGRPDLYTVTLELLCGDEVSDSHSFAFGVRIFEMHDWIPHLNGVRFLIKGNNYPPGDVRIATMNRERVARDLELVRNCHMNLLRIHAHVDHPALYEVADEQGVLIWQDFPLQWLYRREVLPEAVRQARQMVGLLYNHPSVVLWCMHNEPVYVADTNDESWWSRMRTYATTFGFSWNRDVMDSRLKRAVQALDPSRPAVRSSGEFAIPFYREGTDAHAYFGWYDSYGDLPTLDRLMAQWPANLRFCTEFGAQSLPNYESALKFMAAEIEALDVARLKQRHGFQAEIMAKWVDWRGAPTLQEAIARSQDYQIFFNRHYIDRLRYHKYRPTGGIVPFMLVDPWPAILFSIIDYWRIPKRSYYAMKMAFAPQYAFTIYPAGRFPVGKPITLPLYAVNDAHEPVQVRLIVILRSPEGAHLAEVRHALLLAADCLTHEVDRLRFVPRHPGVYQLAMQLIGGSEPVEHSYRIEVV